jgi:hypothetical protein
MPSCAVPDYEKVLEVAVAEDAAYAAAAVEPVVSSDAALGVLLVATKKLHPQPYIRAQAGLVADGV